MIISQTIKRTYKYIPFFFIFLYSCAPKPVSKDYFFDPTKIKGGEPPSPPPFIQDAYFLKTTEREDIYGNIITTKDVYINWDTPQTNSIQDPEGAQISFKLYITTEYPEPLYEYQPIDIRGSAIDPNTNEIIYDVVDPEELNFTYKKLILLFTNQEPITVYVFVTAFDGGRESQISNIKEVDIP